MRAAPAACILALAACGGPATGAAPPAYGAGPAIAAAAGSPIPIRHVVVVIQENRSFENLFAGYPGADAPANGRTHDGAVVPLHAVTFARVGLDHSAQAARTEYRSGTMDGFDLVKPQMPPGLPRTFAYAYVRRDLIAPYWALARRYVLADRFFPREWGPSFTAHLNLITGTTQFSPDEAVVNDPALVRAHLRDACHAAAGTRTDAITRTGRIVSGAGPYPCYGFRSAADVLDEAGVSWRHYDRLGARGGGWLWNSFGALRAVRFGADWKNVVTAPGAIQLAAKRGALPAVAWVTPTYRDSDHPAVGSDTGPSWVASVVNAVGEGPQWKSSLIVVLWDDWGGWYDDAPPPQLDFMGLGIRTPCLIVSPYAKRGYVSHTQYESASVLKTIEKIFGAAPVGSTDVRANDMLDALDFTQPPRPFRHVASKYPGALFLRARPGDDAVPDGD